jgi:hypothetical protein
VVKRQTTDAGCTDGTDRSIQEKRITRIISARLAAARERKRYAQETQADMRPKPDADPELLSRPKSRPWHRSFSSLGRLMTLVALSGLALAAYSERSRPQPPGLALGNLMLRQRTPGFLQQSPVPSSVDPSIIVAPPGIDEAMIVTARVGIDEAMIVNPP